MNKTERAIKKILYAIDDRAHLLNVLDQFDEGDISFNSFEFYEDEVVLEIKFGVTVIKEYESNPETGLINQQEEKK
jgi:hypothetical protein